MKNEFNFRFNICEIKANDRDNRYYFYKKKCKLWDISGYFDRLLIFLLKNHCEFIGTYFSQMMFIISFNKLYWSVK